MTNKRIDDEEISKLQAISNEILISQVPSLASIHEQLQKHFVTPLFKKQAKLQFLDSHQANKQLIEQYGLFLEGHTNRVTSVAITSDNKFIVSGSADNTVRVWNLQDKRQEAVLEGHTHVVTSVAITSDNKFIVSRSYDNTVRVWNLQNKHQEAVLADRNSASSWIQQYPEVDSFFIF